jgi:hypothetical protein
VTCQWCKNEKTCVIGSFYGVTLAQMAGAPTCSDAGAISVSHALIGMIAVTVALINM